MFSDIQSLIVEEKKTFSFVQLWILWQQKKQAVHTSCLSDDLKVWRKRSIAYWGVGQHLDVVGLVGNEALDGDKVRPPNNLLLPEVDVLGGIHGVVDSVAHDLPVGLLRFVPVYDSGGGTQHVTSDLPWRRAGRLLSCFGLDALARWPTPDVVHRHYPELVVRVRAEASHAVSGGSYAVDLLVRVLRVLGLVLDDVVGHRFRVAGVPSQCYTGGCALCHHRDARSLWQCCDDN